MAKATKIKHNYLIDNEKKIIYVDFDKLQPEERNAVDNYVYFGYKLEKKKAKTKTVAEIREELAADVEALKNFDAAYAEKATGDKFKDTGFGKAMKVYQAWKKNNKKKNKNNEEEAAE